MRTEEDQMYFCLFFYVLLVTLRILLFLGQFFPRRPPASSLKKRNKKRTGFLRPPPAPHSKLGPLYRKGIPAFRKRTFSNSYLYSIILGINSWQIISTPVSPSFAGWLFLQHIYAAVVWPQLHGNLTTCFRFFRKFTPFWRFSLEILHFFVHVDEDNEKATTKSINCVTRAPFLYFIRSWVALSFKVCQWVSEWVSKAPLTPVQISTLFNI